MSIDDPDFPAAIDAWIWREPEEQEENCECDGTGMCCIQCARFWNNVDNQIDAARLGE